MTKSEIIAALRQARRAKNLTQHDLGVMLGVTEASARAAISAIERGGSLSIDRMLELAQALDVEIVARPALRADKEE